MADQKTPYTLSLSPAELRWLAGSFGLTRLALPVDLPPASAHQLRLGQESLAGRGLIRRDPGTGWQADQLAVFLVQWLGTAEAYTRLEVHPRRGEPVRAGIYSLRGLYLLIGCAQEQVECLFLSDEKALMAELVRRLDPSIGSGHRLKTVRAGEGEYTLPQPLELIRAAWQDPNPVRRALVNSGLSKREAASTLAWIQSLKTVITFSPVPQEGKEPLLLCGDGSGLWAGRSGKFVPCSWKDSVSRVREML